jgi:hypothetical protein
MKKPSSKRRDGKLKRTIRKNGRWLKRLVKLLTISVVLLRTIIDMIDLFKK